MTLKQCVVAEEVTGSGEPILWITDQGASALMTFGEGIR